ncbi:MAG TPA: phospholipase D-like domain-containing protein [Blastocatellia bacterium]|nr:phospholipase D-like domain-containing protein [Blastocatellia bacterium]
MALKTPQLKQADRRPARFPAEQAFSRTAGVPLIAGNSVRLLRDARENYPAWLEAISSAERWIHFESYIIHEDDQGRMFAEALAAKARAGVRVRVIYDWMGALNATSNRFWRQLREAGVEVRCFNPPQLDSPFGWLSRDHRKMIGVDGRVGFVAGLCVGRHWVGWPEKGIEPWRDTGIEVRGPALYEIEQAFAQAWAATGGTLPEDELPVSDSIPQAGDVALRVVAGMPYTSGLYRLDQLIATIARDRLWLTDAYFVGTSTYVQSLRAAALDGVDVRLLVPRASDILLMRSLSRAGFRPLLEAGVRVFEWNGPMLHAKTALADGHWARVGSSNLNLASWLGNWELDVVVENSQFAREMEQMYLDDLSNATEIVLSARNRLRTIGQRRKSRRRRTGEGSASRAAAGAMRISRAVGAAITNQRVLGPAEARLMVTGSLLLLGLSLVAFLWPKVIALPVAVIGAWIAFTLLIRAWELHRKRDEEAAAQFADSESSADDESVEPEEKESLKP